MAVALSKGISRRWRLWREHFAVMSLNYFAAASAAFFLHRRWCASFGCRRARRGRAAAARSAIWRCARGWAASTTRSATCTTVNRLYLSTISALSTAIEAKDGVTSDHIHRVQAYALGLARALGITDEPTLKALEAAALLHDTGKIAIPEHILNKPGQADARPSSRR